MLFIGYAITNQTSARSKDTRCLGKDDAGKYELYKTKTLIIKEYLDAEYLLKEVLKDADFLKKYEGVDLRIEPLFIG